MIVIVSSFWRKTTKEIQSTPAHVVFDVQNKMTIVDSRDKHFKSHYKEMSEAKKDTAVHNKHAYSSKKNHHECLSAFTGYSFTARSNAARIAPARKQRSCGRFPRNQGWCENVWRDYSEKRFEKTFRVSRATFLYIYIEQGTG